MTGYFTSLTTRTFTDDRHLPLVISCNNMKYETYKHDIGIPHIMPAGGLDNWLKGVLTKFYG